MNTNIFKNIFKLGFIAIAVLGLSFAVQAASLGANSSAGTIQQPNPQACAHDPNKCG